MNKLANCSEEWAESDGGRLVTLREENSRLRASLAVASVEVCALRDRARCLAKQAACENARIELTKAKLRRESRPLKKGPLTSPADSEAAFSDWVWTREGLMFTRRVTLAAAKPAVDPPSWSVAVLSGLSDRLLIKTCWVAWTHIRAIGVSRRAAAERVTRNAHWHPFLRNLNCRLTAGEARAAMGSGKVQASVRSPQWPSRPSPMVLEIWRGWVVWPCRCVDALVEKNLRPSPPPPLLTTTTPLSRQPPAWPHSVVTRTP